MFIVDNFSRVNVLCVGDVMLDRFIHGSVNRISPESPVPVLSITAVKAVPGGAANVARNVVSLGGRCTLIGIIGDDIVGRELTASLASVDGVTPALIVADDKPTTEKTRYIAQGQQLLRADQENAMALTPQVESQVLSMIEAHIATHQVLVLSDYAKGALTDRVVSGAIALARRHHVPVIVDPKSPVMSRYAGATVVTPNAKEVHAATGIDPTDDDLLATRAGEKILASASIESVLVTRAHKGMTLVSRTAEPVHLSASAREVFDVVGAGDTVVATLALAVGAGDSLSSAARLATVAAGIVVGKRGTATVSQSELVDEITRLGAGHLASLRAKVLSLPEALTRAAAWRRDGLDIGFTNGCFDLLHVGHLSLLSFARSHCGRLIVGLNSDESIRRLKGPSRPITSQVDRAMVLAALSAVDAVVLFDEDTPIEMIRSLDPQVLFKGADYAIDQVIGSDLVLGRGGRVLTAELVPGKSTTSLLGTLRGTSLPLDAAEAEDRLEPARSDEVN